MWRSVKELIGYRVKTKDETYGRVKDFYFDDHRWIIRYMVLETGNWLPGQLVLISPETFLKPDWSTKLFPLNITKQQIENSPPIEADKPVSRQHETELFNYYRWTPYWTVPPLAGGGSTGTSVNPPFPDIEKKRLATMEREQDPHLRSAREVIGYAMEATDGRIGHIDDFIVNDQDWVVRYMVADPKSWLPNKSVLIAAQWIKNIRWMNAIVEIDLTKDQIRHSPAYDSSEPVNREYEARLYDYYGRPRYWE